MSPTKESDNKNFGLEFWGLNFMYYICTPFR